MSDHSTEQEPRPDRADLSDARIEAEMAKDLARAERVAAALNGIWNNLLP